MSTMKQILVLGIGSRLMTDDGIGIYLVKDLKQLGTEPNIKYVVGETDVDYCLAEVLQSDYVMIIDAFLSGKSPGEITVVPLSALKEGNDEGCFSQHGMHFLNALKHAKQMTEGILIGIEPYEINYGFNLSDMLQSCYTSIFEAVREQVEKYVELYGGTKNA